MGEPHDVTFPSMRNKTPWKPASLWPELLYKCIFISPSPSLSLLAPGPSPPPSVPGHLTPLLLPTAELLLVLAAPTPLHFPAGPQESSPGRKPSESIWKPDKEVDSETDSKRQTKDRLKMNFEALLS